MSTFRCEVVPVVLEPHPHADTLSLVRVWGYTVVVKTADWLGRDRGVYIPPDSVVPDDDRFHWLYEAKATKDRPIDSERAKRYGRITVRRFRGIYSQGLLVPVESTSLDSPIGANFAEVWGITHWEPPVTSQTDGDAVAGPPGAQIPVYDVESYNRYKHCLPEGTPVYITEKVHGYNARYVWHEPYVGDGSMMTLETSQEAWMYAGSRSQWKKDVPGNVWWSALRQNPWVQEWCMAHPNVVLYGEVFGQVQDLKYGAANGQLFFLAFDVLANGQWADYVHLWRLVPSKYRMPELYTGPFGEGSARALAELDSTLCPGQLSEGVVICPLDEITHPEIGRVQLKIVSNRYLERG